MAQGFRPCAIFVGGGRKTSVVPPGRAPFVPVFPALKRWAIVAMPLRGGVSRGAEAPLFHGGVCIDGGACISVFFCSPAEDWELTNMGKLSGDGEGRGRRNRGKAQKKKVRRANRAPDRKSGV